MKILLIDVFQKKTIEALAKLPNVEVLYLPEIQRDEILLLIEEVNVLILNSKTQIDKALIDRAKALRLVIRAGVGLDHFDLPYLAEKNILARNTAGANADSVGEQTVGMLLALHHQLMKANAEVKQFEWIREPNRALEIKGKTVGIVGYGNTGKSVAKKLSGFDCQVLAYDKYKENYGDRFAQAVSMETIFEQADILTLHIPLTAETHHLANFSFFERFAKPLTFLNLSRGKVVELGGLIQALDTKKVRATALDVLENEQFTTLTPLQKENYQNLFQRNNVILSPHIGGWSFESLDNIHNEIVTIVERFMDSRH